MAVARNTDPPTSHNAKTHGFALDREKVFDVHYRHPDGLTDFELAAIMGKQQTSVGKRRLELCHIGFVEDAGFTRPAPSGASAIVWSITGLGLLAYRRKKELDANRITA